MAIESLKDVYIDQLQDMYSACQQSHDVTKALARAATDPNLREALERGVGGIERGMSTVKEILKSHDADPEGEHCKGMEGLVKEAHAHALEAEFGDDAARDAMIITQYQRMAHYAIAGYGCCHAFAQRLEQSHDARRLSMCLDKSYDGDREMTALAENGVNRKAA
ncbi:MAG: DUF892 family protein [Pseudomonadota bacterium]